MSEKNLSVTTGVSITKDVSTPSKELSTVKRREVKPKKPKGKPRGGNSPMIGDNGLTLEAGDNTKYLTVNIALLSMEQIDLHNVEEVEQRLREYFTLYAEHDMKPTVAGMALALNGMRRQQLWAIVHDRPTGGAGYMAALPSEVANAIKKAYVSMENLWEIYMLNGKINPVSGIFLGKNNFGYQDKTEYVLTPNTQNESDYDPEDIKQRYLPGKTLPTLEEPDEET